MSCPINSIVTLDCNDGISGIEWVAVTETENLTDGTFTSDASGNVTAFTLESGKYMYKIELSKETAGFTQSQSDPTETQSPMWTQVLTFTIKKLSANKKRYLQLLAYNRLTVLIKTRNGEYLLMGKTGGYQSAEESSTGIKFGEFNGSAITITAREPLPYYVVASNQVVAGLVQGL